MKTILYRYLVKEQLLTISVCFFGLSLILIMGRLLQLTRYLFTSSLTVTDLLGVIALALPELILFALPMATLTGVLLAFVRLNSDNELIAIRSAGVGFRELLPPVMSVLLLMTVLSFFNTLYIIPSANLAFKEKLRSLGRASVPALLREGTFIDTIPNLVFFFESVNPSNLAIEGIFVQDHRKPDVQLSIVAERAQVTYQKDMRFLTFKIFNGIITRVADDLKDAQAVSFKAYDLTLSLEDMLQVGEVSKGKREMSIAELLEMIRLGGGNPDARYILEVHRRLALPVGCMLLGLLGAPLGAIFRPRSRMAGMTLGLLAFLGYYLILSAGNGIGKNGLIPPVLGAWIPNILTLLGACYLWIKMQKETPFKLAFLWERIQPYMKSLLNGRRAHKEPSA
jgi:lipopolysaccharide export system permease protein